MTPVSEALPEEVNFPPHELNGDGKNKYHEHHRNNVLTDERLLVI